MNEGNLIVYKISREGTLDLIDVKDLMDAFTQYDVLVILNQASKRLYVWKGNHLERILEKYVPEAKDLILKQDQNVRILRHIVVESGNEPQEFFDDLKLNPALFKVQLEKEKQIPTRTSKIVNEIKIEADDIGNELTQQENEASITENLVKQAAQIDIPPPEQDTITIEQTTNVENVAPEQPIDNSKSFPENLPQMSVELNRWDILPARRINNIDYTYDSIFTTKREAQQKLMELSTQSEPNRDAKLITIIRAKFRNQGPFNEDGIGYAIYLRDTGK